MFSRKVLQYHQAPSQPTGELFGVEYLHNQSDFQLDHLEDEEEVDEGLGDETLINQSALSYSEHLSTFILTDSEDEVNYQGIYI